MEKNIYGNPKDDEEDRTGIRGKRTGRPERMTKYILYQRLFSKPCMPIIEVVPIDSILRWPHEKALGQIYADIILQNIIS